MKIRVLIVEDEFPIALDIESRLENMEYDVVGIANSYDDALPFLLEEEIDIAILDVNLEEEKSGIDLGKLILKKFNLPIVYLTAYTDSLTFDKALEADPMGYITKPFKDADLHSSLQLALKKYRSRIQEAVNESPAHQEDDFFIKEKGVIHKINKKDILWIEAMDNYTILYTESGKHIVKSYLKDVLEKLAPCFIRIHRSYAIAKEKITSIEDNTLYIGKHSLVISKSHKQALLKELNML